MTRREELANALKAQAAEERGDPPPERPEHSALADERERQEALT